MKENNIFKMMIINNEDIKDANFYFKIKGKDLYMHVIKIFQDKFHEKSFNYKEISSYIMHDKSLRDNLFSYFAYIEEHLRSKLLNKDFKQWHHEQRALMTIHTLKLQGENILNKDIYDNLQIQKEKILKCLLLDINNNERMLLQSVLNALDNIQHYQLLLNLSKSHEQKLQYQEQLSLWQDKSKTLQLSLAPILLSFKP